MGSKKISIIGLGYVGLCTAVGFANNGYKVISVDKDPEKIELVKNGTPPFHEPFLKEYLKKAIKNKILRSILDIEQAISQTELTFVTVGTPSNPDGSINLEQIEESAIEIGKALTKKSNYHLIVIKSTVVPGTTENVVKPLLEFYSQKICGLDIGLCMNPEFLREGSAVLDAENPDRVVIGEYDKKSGDMLYELYNELHYKDKVKIIRTNLSTAEIIKYANNAFLATKISYINTIANICEKIPGADVKVVSKAIGLDQRINPRFLNAGLGYGGSCFAKDVKAIISFSNNYSYFPELLNATQIVNEKQAYFAVKKAKKHLKELKGKKIAILGLAFKPETDDMREARSIPIINQFLNENAVVTAYDPIAITTAKYIFQDKINYANSSIACLKDANCCILVTEWNEFKNLKPSDFKKYMKQAILIDGRKIYDPTEFEKEIIFETIGYGKKIIRR